jgi:hypothetical protein
MKTTKMKTKLLLLLTFVFAILKIHSQDSIPEIKKYWLDSGIGITSQLEDQSYIAMGFSLNYIENKSHYKLRFLGISEFKIFGQSENVVSIGGLIGKHYSTKFTQISFLGGLGIAFNEELTTNVIGRTGSGWFSSSIYETETSTMLSIPLEIEFLFKPFNFYGLGISLFADINSKKPSFGILLKSGFGKYR